MNTEKSWFLAVPMLSSKWQKPEIMQGTWNFVINLLVQSRTDNMKVATWDSSAKWRDKEDGSVG